MAVAISLILSIIFQLFFGSNYPFVFAFPRNVIILGALVSFVLLTAKASRINRFLISSRLLRLVLLLLLVSCIVIAILPSNIPQNNPWYGFNRIAFVNSWPFACIVLWLQLVLTARLFDNSSEEGRKITVLLGRIGLWVLCASLFFGTCDKIEGKMIVRRVGPDNLLVLPNGKGFQLPFCVQLQNVGSDDDAQKSLNLIVDDELQHLEINHPIHYKGFDIYLHQMPSEQFAVLYLAKDPWKMANYSGIFMVTASLLLRMFYRNKKEKTL